MNCYYKPTFRIFLLIFILLAFSASGRDWFVRAGSPDGDGSSSKPFADPWQALEKYEAGDRINITEGKYYGKLDSGTWKIPLKVELLGGYNKDFTVRDPWKFYSELLWQKDSKNPSDTFRILGESQGGSDPSGTVIDGIIFDMTDVNMYLDNNKTALNPARPRVRGAIGFMIGPVTVRNCVIVNAELYGLRVAPGSTIENNLIINSGDCAVWFSQAAPNAEKKITTVKGNTISFVWFDGDFGKGGPGGIGIKAQDYCSITGNILMYIDNQGIYFPSTDAGIYKKSTVKNNIFFGNFYANVRLIVDGNDSVIDRDSMDLFEEVGFKAQSDNEDTDPQFDMDPKWMDMYSKRSAGSSGKMVMDDWNKARKALGLPLISTGGTGYSGYMPAYDWKKALTFLTPKNKAVKAGARIVACTVPEFTGPSTAPAHDYVKTDVAAVKADPAGFNGKYIELLVALGGTYNTGSFTAGNVKGDTHETATVYDIEGKGITMALAVKKGTTAYRNLNDAFNGPSYNGVGKPARIYMAKGQAFALTAIIKAGIVIDSFEAYEAGAAGPPRPQGRDWFVAANTSGGDGTKEKPFKDPYQAIEKAEIGDTIHVAEGEYYGKMKVGLWKVTTKYLALLGGYNKEFTERDPWKRPTVLMWPIDSKTQPLGYTLEGEGEVTGMVVDGFVFDKKLRNFYLTNGDMEFSRSDTRYSVFIPSPEGVVRNCVFVNHALSPIKMTEPFTFENNIVMNTVNAIMDISANTAQNTIIRGNTFLFSWDKRFGNSQSSTGFAITVRKGPVIIDSNIFMFMDNNALKIYANPREVVLTGNVFNKNLWSNVLVNENKVIDDKTFSQLGDVGFKKSEGNQVDNPNFELDPKWMDVYMYRTAYVPGKVEMDDWNNLRSLMGQPLLAKGGKAADGFAPAYDWKKAVRLFPRNNAVKAGARQVKIEVKFTGVAKKDPTEGKSYKEISFSELAENYDKYKDKRIAVEVAFGNWTSSTWVPSAYSDKTVWNCAEFYGPEGKKGASWKALVKISTAAEKVINDAPELKEWQKPEALYIIKGIVLSDKYYFELEGVEQAEEE